MQRPERENGGFNHKWTGINTNGRFYNIIDVHLCPFVVEMNGLGGGPAVFPDFGWFYVDPFRGFEAGGYIITQLESGGGDVTKRGMQIFSAVFDRSAPDLDSCPDESLPEFAFIGRSNAGKSSLLNFLAGRDGLARVSPTPGFTRMINVFTVNKNWRLVDLPGYGFAQGAKKDSAKFNKAVMRYLKHRPNLCCVFALVDSGLEPQDIDVEFIEWLARNAVPFVLVFTKTDKHSSAAVAANIAAFQARIAPWFVELPAHFTCSSVSGAGRTELLNMIEETLVAINAPSNQMEDAPEKPAKKASPEKAKKRVDLQRPW